MSPAEWFAHPVCQAVTLALLHFLWQGLLVAIGLAALVELLGLRRPAVRHACSLAALLLMAACPLVTLTWQVIEERPPDISPHSLATRVTRVSAPLDLASAGQTGRVADVIAAAQPYVLAAWLVGVAFFGCRLLIGLVGLGQLRRDRMPLPRELAAHVELLGRRLGMRARSVVFLSRRVSEAMAVGLLRPLVLIPAAWATEMPPAMLEAVIAHELAHLRRQDLWINLVQRIVETLLFYHPAVWWLSRRLRAERELCCDELAVAVTGQRLEYVEALEHVARRRAARVEPALAAGIRGEKNMRLLERVRNVLGLSAAPERSLWPAGLLALLLPLGVWAYATGLIPTSTVVVADDDREDDDDDDDDDREEGRKEGERDDDDDEDGDDEDGDDDDEDGDDDDDEKQGKKSEREDDDEKEGKGDDDKDEKEVRKEGDREREDGERKEIRREEVRRVEIRRDGDNPEAARLKRERLEEARFFGKEDEARRDGDRPAKEGSRDGEVRKEGPRDGDKRPVKEGERDGEKKPAKDSAAYIEELLTMVKKLSIENERMRAELAEIRGGAVDKASTEKGRNGFYRVREGQAAAKEAAAKEKDAAVREKEAVYKRAADEKEEAIRRGRKVEQSGSDYKESVRKEFEARARKIKESGDDAAEVKEALIRRDRELIELIEKKKAAVREAEERKEGERKEGERKDDERKEKDDQ